MRIGLAYPQLKRFIDVVLSAGGLIALAPVLLGVAAAVRVGSPGPILFRQKRVGLGGRTFALLKFRSMRVSSGGPLVTSASDTRITPIGKVIRKTKLDEMPQLINVLRGDMSLVGPRPEVPRYVDLFPAEYARILSVRPGITDLAAIAYRNEEELLARAVDPEREYVQNVLPAKIALYEQYIRQMSLSTDLAILARTAVAIIK
jgi:lipopolysaccharide/colanic/teichoic acid biosynthesis glycosyltransferase